YFNGYGWRELESAIANPPQALLDAVDSMRERIADVAIPQSRTRRVCPKSEQDEELSALAWAMRDPIGWTQIRSIAQPRDTVTVGINLSVGWRQKPSELLYRGAAVAALSDILESAGHSVEIVAFKVTNEVTDRVGRALTRVTVKASDQPLDIGAVALALAEIAFIRLALMSANARRLPGTLTRSWGKVDSLAEHERTGIDILAERDITSESAAVEWIRRVNTV